TYFSAYLRQARRTSAVDICAFFEPSSLSTLISIGSPWQSQPGTYGESKPAMVFDLTTKSFRILLNAVPKWMRPLAYGGPSCRTYVGRPARDSRMRRYRPSFSHRSS